MTNKKYNIEDLFKDNLKDYSISPSNSVWNKINRKLFLKKFLKFNPTTFNLYYTILIGAITTIGILNINNKQQTPKLSNLQENKKAISQKTNSVTPIKTLISENINTEKKGELTEKENNLTIEKENKEKTTQINNLTTETLVNKITTKDNANFDVEKNNNSKLAKPSANFSASTYSACEPATIVFTNASENCNSFLWDFGNEATSKKANPTFVFKTAGKYTVKLTVYSGSIFSTIEKEIIILKRPKSNFILSNKNNLFKNDEIKFANLSTDFSSCKWNFGDGNSSNFTNPSNVFEDAGLYNVSLICFSKNNCSDTTLMKSLKIQENKYKILAPTALTPDINGASSGYLQKDEYSNSIFRPNFNINPSEYYLRIFNKFGSVVFESRDINYGWNGYYNNKPAPFDVYIWECTGKFSDGHEFIKTGNLTLLYLKNQ